MSSGITDFKMPRYEEIPNIGLYLDQTVKYINEVMSPLGCVEVTPSMISNYVKKRYISKPVKKLYSRDQIGILMIVALAKLVLGMDQIEVFLKAYEGRKPDGGKAYDLFCKRFEYTLMYIFGKKGSYREEFFSFYENDGYTSLSRKEGRSKTAGGKKEGMVAEDDNGSDSGKYSDTPGSVMSGNTNQEADPEGNAEAELIEAVRAKNARAAQSRAEEAERMTNSLLIAVAHCIYINYCLTKLVGARVI